MTTTQATIRDQLSANPAIKAVVKELFDEQLIDGLRDVIRIIPTAQAEAEWQKIGGYIQRRPVMPPRKNSVANGNTACRFSHLCDGPDCNPKCAVLTRLNRQ